MHSKDEYLDVVLPYRMKSVDVLRVALQYVLAWEKPKTLEIYFGGKLAIRGLSTAWTNPVIEAGIIHCRALLEFLGLKEDHKNRLKLINRPKKRKDDYGIEDFGFPLVTVEEAVRPYKGPSAEAEKALAAIIHCANKGIGHTTLGQLVVEEDLKLYEIASRGVPALLVNKLYVPLGKQPPDYEISSNPRENQ